MTLPDHIDPDQDRDLDLFIQQHRAIEKYMQPRYMEDRTNLGLEERNGLPAPFLSDSQAEYFDEIAKRNISWIGNRVVQNVKLNPIHLGDHMATAKSPSRIHIRRDGTIYEIHLFRNNDLIE